MEKASARSAWIHGAPRTIRLLSTLACVGLFAAHAGAAPSLVNVTPLDGLSLSVGVALSADGTTVVGSRPRQDRTTLLIDNRAFLWTQSDGYRLFDELEPGAPGQADFQPYDVSGDGSRIVGSLDGLPVYWDRGGATTALPLLPGGTDGGAALAVSDDGHRIVGRAHDGGVETRFVVTPGGGIVAIEDPRLVPAVWNLDEGTVIAVAENSGSALDVSNDGVAVGNLELPGTSGATFGFRWDASAGLQRLPSGNPNPATLAANTANAVSTDGTTVVGLTPGPPPPGSTSQFGASRAYQWSGEPGAGDTLPADGLQLLENPSSIPLPPTAGATGISADGSTIVGAYYREVDVGLRLRPFIWTRAGGFQDLEILLNTLGISTADWNLFGALDVSADGTTIVGTGQFRSSTGPRSDAVWIAVIPEPSTALLLGMGLSLLAGAGHSRRFGRPDRRV